MIKPKQIPLLALLFLLTAAIITITKKTDETNPSTATESSQAENPIVLPQKSPDFQEITKIEEPPTLLWKKERTNPSPVRTAPYNAGRIEKILATKPGQQLEIDFGHHIELIQGVMQMNVLRDDGTIAINIGIDPSENETGGTLSMFVSPEGEITGTIQMDDDLRNLYLIQSLENGDIELEYVEATRIICTSTDFPSNISGTGLTLPEPANTATSSPAVAYTPDKAVTRPSQGKTRKYNLRFEINPPAKKKVNLSFTYTDPGANGNNKKSVSGTISIEAGRKLFDIPVTISGGNSQNNQEMEIQISQNGNDPEKIEIYPAIVKIPSPAALTTTTTYVPRTAAIVTQGEIPAWSSKPNAPKVIYLDFDGAVLKGTVWNKNNNTVTTASLLTKFKSAGLKKIWETTAESFSAFQVNVTTDKVLYENTPPQNRIWVLFTPEIAALYGGNYAGVSYIGVFGRATYQPTLVFTHWTTNTTYISLAAAHEIGHSYGLNHHGTVTPSVEYYTGHGSGNNSWGTIMGSPYYRTTRQWSHGKYANASNPNQNDTAVIRSITPYELDEVGTNSANAVRMSNTGVSQTTARITSPNDSDYFRLDPEAGKITIEVQRTSTYDSAFVPDVRILTSTGPLEITQTDRGWTKTTSKVTWTGTLPKGSVIIIVKGGSYGTSLTGFDNYGSIGAYTVKTTAPVPAPAYNPPPPTTETFEGLYSLPDELPPELPNCGPMLDTPQDPNAP